MACIYALVSTRDESKIRYIGMSRDDDPTRRTKRHMQLAARPTQPVHSWVYGELSAGYDIKSIVLESGLSEAEARGAERAVITLLKPSCMLLNKNAGGAGSSHSHTEEFKERQRERFLGDSNPSKREDVRKKISASLTGRPGHKHTEETKQHLREVLKGVNKGRKQNLTDEQRRARSERSAAQRHSDETKRKIGAAHKGRPKSEEQRRKQSEAMQGRKLSDAHRQAIADGLRRRRENQ